MYTLYIYTYTLVFHIVVFWYWHGTGIRSNSWPSLKVLRIPRGVQPCLYRCSEEWNSDYLGMFGGLGRLGHWDPHAHSSVAWTHSFCHSVKWHTFARIATLTLYEGRLHVRTEIVMKGLSRSRDIQSTRSGENCQTNMHNPSEEILLWFCMSL